MRGKRQEKTDRGRGKRKKIVNSEKRSGRERVTVYMLERHVYLGRRCLGQGMRPNSCGTEYRKLRIWGMKKRSIVLLK